MIYSNNASATMSRRAGKPSKLFKPGNRRYDNAEGPIEDAFAAAGAPWAWSPYLWTIGALALIIGLAALFTVIGVAIVGNETHRINNRHISRLENRVTELEAANLDDHNDVNVPDPEQGDYLCFNESSDTWVAARVPVTPVGFLAYVDGPESLPNSSFNTLDGWSTSGGSPAYDASGGAFNPTTGIYTAPEPGGKFMVSGNLCWQGDVGVRTLILAVGAGNQDAFPSTSQSVPDAGDGVCSSISMSMYLPTGMTVRMLERHPTGEPVFVFARRFSVERIAD